MKINKIFSLTKVFLKNSFKSIGRNNADGEKKRIGLILLYIFSFAYLAAIMGFMSYGMIQSLALIGQEQVFLNLFFLGLGLLFVFQSVFSCINVFYFSKDVEMVLPLPLKPYEIILSKLNTILVTEYITEIIFGFLPLMIYGIVTSAGFLYYIMSIIALIVFPILPLLFVSVIIMIIMSFAKITKYKDKFQMIVGTISILLIIAIQFLAFGNTEELTEAQIAEKLIQTNGMVDLIGDYVITLKPIIQAITAENIVIAIIEIGKVILFTIIGYAITLLIGQKIYLKGAIGSSAGGSTKKKKIDGQKIYCKHIVAVSYVKKEFKILTRNPVFFMQCVLPAILMPVLFLAIALAGGNGASNETMLSVKEIIKGVNPVIIIFIITGITQFLGMMIYVATTAISRDGQSAEFIKYIPVSFHKQFIYKIIPNIILNIISMLIVFILVGIILQINVYLYIPIFIIGFLFAVIRSYLELLVDLRKPKLQWDTEYAVVKQNMNLIWTMIYGMLAIGLIIATAVIGEVFKIDARITISGLILALCIAFYFLDYYVEKKQEILFEKIY